MVAHVQDFLRQPINPFSFTHFLRQGFPLYPRSYQSPLAQGHLSLFPFVLRRASLFSKRIVVISIEIMFKSTSLLQIFSQSFFFCPLLHKQLDRQNSFIHALWACTELASNLWSISLLSSASSGAWHASQYRLQQPECHSEKKRRGICRILPAAVML